MTDTVDLRSEDDDATLDEMEQQTEPDPAPEPEPATTDTDDVRELAASYRNDSGANSVVEQLKDAMESAQADLGQLQQLHSRYEQERKQAEQRIDRLDETFVRVIDQPNDVPILQTMAGGISFEVPPADGKHAGYSDSGHAEYVSHNEGDETYTRADLLDEIDETVDALEDQCDALDEQLEKVESSHQRVAAAHGLLERAYQKQREADAAAADLIDDTDGTQTDW